VFSLLQDKLKSNVQLLFAWAGIDFEYRRISGRSGHFSWFRLGSNS
jgi:hypothetical protein